MYTTIEDKLRLIQEGCSYEEITFLESFSFNDQKHNMQYTREQVQRFTDHLEFLKNRAEMIRYDSNRHSEYKKITEHDIPLIEDTIRKFKGESPMFTIRKK